MTYSLSPRKSIFYHNYSRTIHATWHAWSQSLEHAFICVQQDYLGQCLLAYLENIEMVFGNVYMYLQKWSEGRGCTRCSLTADLPTVPMNHVNSSLSWHLPWHLHRHCITQTWIYIKHVWFSFPFFSVHTSYAFDNNLFTTEVYIPNRICILCEFTIIGEFSHTLLILSLKASGWVTREDIKIILHWNMPAVLYANEGLWRKELWLKLRKSQSPTNPPYCNPSLGMMVSFSCQANTT